MDIAGLSIVMSQQKTQDAVGISLMRMVMGNAKEKSSEMIKMIENMAVDPNLGHNLDIKA